MSFLKNKAKKKTFILLSVLFIFLVIIISCIIYLNDYYRADLEAIVAFSTSNNISKEVLDDNTIVYSREDAKIGLIFYPGGKVEYISYEPLMKECASSGFLCVLVKMPFNLAVFDINAANGIQEQYPDIEKWYIGGHSLGGSMAASYLSKNVDKFEGLILLGSYSTADLSNTSLDVISIYGSEDRVLNHKKYNKNKSNLPVDFKEVVIDGGCHAYFGMYGKQEGDGNCTISNSDQVIQTMQIISNYIRS